MTMQECGFKIEVTPCDKGEKKAVLAFFKDFKASGGFDQLDRIHDFSSRVMYQGFPGGGRYMVEPCPDAVAFVEKFRAHFPGISYSAELRIDFTGGDSLPPDIYRWISEDVEKRVQDGVRLLRRELPARDRPDLGRADSVGQNSV